MTTIYQVANQTQDTVNWICDSQATIDEGKEAGFTGIFSIGTGAEASTILTINRELCLTSQANNFYVNEKKVTDAGIEWVAVNLLTEPQNVDKIYVLLNVPNGNWIQKTGLNSAKTEFENIQQNYLVFVGLGSIKLLTKWPVNT
jgi:hypothetical protein